MNRTQLKQIAGAVAVEAARKGYDYWLEQTDDKPIVFSKTVDRQEVQVEIQVWERTEGYVQSGVSAGDSGFLASRFPPGTTVLVEKNAPIG